MSDFLYIIVDYKHKACNDWPDRTILLRLISSSPASQIAFCAYITRFLLSVASYITANWTVRHIWVLLLVVVLTHPTDTCHFHLNLPSIETSAKFPLIVVALANSLRIIATSFVLWTLYLPKLAYPTFPWLSPIVPNVQWIASFQRRLFFCIAVLSYYYALHSFVFQLRPCCHRPNQMA